MYVVSSSNDAVPGRTYCHANLTAFLPSTSTDRPEHTIQRCSPSPPQDIKAANVLLTAGAVAKLSDVGLSRLQKHSFLTHTGAITGTFSW